MSYLGRDFSSYQGNLSPADCEGIQFAYVKATEGADYKNPYAPQQVAALHAAGVEVGYYHFLDPIATTPVGDQLDNFHKMVQALGRTTLPLAVDTEVNDESWAALASDLVQFAMNVEGWQLWVPNPKSLLYVDLYYYANLPGFPWGRWCWLADPGVAAPAKPCLIWQQAPRPVSSTDLKSVDPDVFMGTEAEWQTFIGQAATAPPPAPIVPLPGTVLVPGTGIPGAPELIVIGEITAPSTYTGRNVGGGAPVYAGLGDPTQWVSGFDKHTLPIGTPIATLASEEPNVGTSIVAESW